MLLRSVYLVLLVSLAITVDVSGMSVSAENVVGRYNDVEAVRNSLQQVHELSSSRSARTRQFRRAFKRSLVQIFGMKTLPRRQATSGGGHVPAYMRWLYEQSSAGRLSAVVKHLHRRRGRSSYRQKRHSQDTANTVRSFTARFAGNSSLFFT